MWRFPRLAAALWAWGVETGWAVIKPELESEATLPDESYYYFPAGGGIWGDQ